MDTRDPDDQAGERPDSPEFDRLKSLLLSTNERIEAGEDSAEVTSEAHQLLDPGGD